MQHEPSPSPQSAPPDPPSNQNFAARPSRIGFVRNVVLCLLGFGRHLSSSVKQRAEAPNFPGIAVGFGTARVAAISAHLQRGILRAMALENVLRARFVAGRDLEIIGRGQPPRTRKPAPDPTAAAPSAAPSADPCIGPSAGPSPSPPPASDAASPVAQAAAAAQAVPNAMRRRAPRPPGWDDPELFMPTLKELEAQIRRRPIGRTIADICLDFGLSPEFCTGQDWNKLFECIHYFGGSLNRMRLERQRRRQTFWKEWDRRPIHDLRSPTFHWWDLGKNGERKVLGFLFGENPVNPCVPRTPAGVTIATGPP